MATRANWFTDLEAVADLAVEDGVDVEQMGFPIDLDDEPTLNKRLIALLGSENDLFNRGVTCPVKDAPDTSCAACPVKRSRGAEAELCDVGVEQEKVLTALAVVRHGVARPS